MERMDWGDLVDFVSFGNIGADQIEQDCQFYVLVAPQNVVGGGAIISKLIEMVQIHSSMRELSQQYLSASPACTSRLLISALQCAGGSSCWAGQNNNHIKCPLRGCAIIIWGHGREVRHERRVNVPQGDGLFTWLRAVLCDWCRGRKERMAFAASFQPAYHFR